jgi:hypothetical protein
MTVNWIDCNGIPQTQIIIAGGGISICACEGSITTEGGAPNIVIIGPCGSCLCIAYNVQNQAAFGDMTVNWTDCSGNPQTQILTAGLGFALCACDGTITTEGGVPQIDIIGPC